MKYRFSQSSIHGTGCFANEDIKKGEIISTEPFFRFQKGTTHPVLNDYFWDYSGEKYIINGIGCYSNHNYENNCKPVLSPEIFKTRMVPFIALMDIKKDNEIMCNYGEGYWKTRQLSNTNTNTNETPSKTITSIQRGESKFTNISRNNMFNLFPTKK